MTNTNTNAPFGFIKNPCTVCGAPIAHSGKRGKPPTAHPECRTQRDSAKKARYRARRAGEVGADIALQNTAHKLMPAGPTPGFMSEADAWQSLTGADGTGLAIVDDKNWTYGATPAKDDEARNWLVKNAPLSTMEFGPDTASAGGNTARGVIAAGNITSCWRCAWAQHIDGWCLCVTELAPTPSEALHNYRWWKLVHR